MIGAWKVYAALGGILVGALVIGGAAWRVHNLEEALAKAEARVVEAEAQTEAAKRNVKIIERYHTNTIRLQRIASDAETAIQRAPGAQDPVPADVLDAWRSGIDGLRSEAPDRRGSPGYPEGAM